LDYGNSVSFLSGNMHNSFSPNLTHDGIIKIQWGKTGAEKYHDVGIDNINFDQKPVPLLSKSKILNFFDNCVDDGIIEGCGRKSWLANSRLWIFKNILESAKWLFFVHNETKHACKLLNVAYKRCDGKNRPPDFVKGKGVPELSNRIKELMDELGCKSNMSNKIRTKLRREGNTLLY
jgi:hypothetical protein